MTLTLVAGTGMTASAQAPEQTDAEQVRASSAQASAASPAVAKELANLRADQAQDAKRAVAAKRAAKARAAAARAAQARRLAVQRWTAPMKAYRFTSEYGPRWGRLHAGIDLAAPVGTPLYAMSTGVVTFAGEKSGYGTALIIQYWDGTKSLYGHINTLGVKVGQAVRPGQQVALSGNTGRSHGPHLHLEIRPKSSPANSMAQAKARLSAAVDSLTLMASNDAMARAGVEPAPVNPVPWMKARGIMPRGANK